MLKVSNVVPQKLNRVKTQQIIEFLAPLWLSALTVLLCNHTFELNKTSIWV